MSNAWFLYVAPLLAGAAFLTFGASLVRNFKLGREDEHGNKFGLVAACGGMLFMCVGGAIALAILLMSPTPWERERLFDRVFRTPPEQIERFVIQAGDADQYRPLTKSEVVINDPARIREIADILRAAPEVWLNHPITRWTVRVELVTRDGSSHFEVQATEPGDRNGTLVNVSANPDGGGCILGYVRADGLEKILEDAVNEAGGR